MSFIERAAGDHALDRIDRDDDVAEAPRKRQRVAVDDVAQRKEGIGPVGEDGRDHGERARHDPREERLKSDRCAHGNLDKEQCEDECARREPAPDDHTESARRPHGHGV